jgi:hypothetical protein
VPHGFNDDTQWPRLWEEPGEPADVRSAVGDFGALNRYGTMSVQVCVAGDGVADERLVGALLHPYLDGVLVATMQDTPSGDVPTEEITALLRELGWRWATAEEALELFGGYMVPGLEGAAARAVDGGARAAALRGLM